MKDSYMILDLQFGSTGKGLLAGYLAKKNCPDTVVTAWGPNAGHTYIDQDGRKFIHTMLANGIVSPNLERVLIGPGSVINLDNLFQEIYDCRDLLKGKQVIIHPQAAIVYSSHREAEKSRISIGSTMKGTSEAMIQRLQRDPDNLNTARVEFHSRDRDAKAGMLLQELDIELVVSAEAYKDGIQKSRVMQIEGAQGYSLSIYHGLYPYTTSRDVTPAQVMADCALPWSMKPSIHGTLRTYPIRVANRYNSEGLMIGTSGPGYDDQYELRWEDMNIEPELTTVTQLPRRIFSFSPKQLEQAVFHCDPDSLFLNFANYMDGIDELESLIDEITEIVGLNLIEHIGFGPGHGDVMPWDEYVTTYPHSE